MFQREQAVYLKITGGTEVSNIVLLLGSYLVSRSFTEVSEVLPRQGFRAESLQHGFSSSTQQLMT